MFEATPPVPQEKVDIFDADYCMPKLWKQLDGKNPSLRWPILLGFVQILRDKSWQCYWNDGGSQTRVGVITSKFFTKEKWNLTVSCCQTKKKGMYCPGKMYLAGEACIDWDNPSTVLDLANWTVRENKKPRAHTYLK